MRKMLIRAALAGVSLWAAASSAQAGGNVFWSIGINAPLDPYGATIGTTISNAPDYYRPAPVYVRPAPVYVQPAPIYYPPAPVYYSAPRPVIVRPQPIYYAQPAPHHGWRHGHPQRRHEQYRDRDDHSKPPVRHHDRNDWRDRGDRGDRHDWRDRRGH